MRLAILSIVAMMLVGCGARQSRPAAVADLDTVKMTQVERTAFARGVKVIWVNPPLARAE
jgi:hypothetical protein